MAEKKRKTTGSKTAGRSKSTNQSKAKTASAKNSSSGKKTTKGKHNSNSKKNTSSAKTTKSANNAAMNRNNKAVSQQEQSVNMVSEGQLILSLCVAGLLLLSNFGLCGTAGKILSSFFFGLFGCTQYVMPIAFFIAVSLLMINDYNTLAMKKCLAGFTVLMMISAFVQLIYQGGDIGIYDLFRVALEDRLTGGIIGGGLACLLKQWFGLAGAWIILICILLLALIMLTQRSMVDFFKNSVGKVKAFINEMKLEKANRPAAEEKKQKTQKDKEREKQCEEKVKEIEEKQKNAKKPAAAKDKPAQGSFHVPIFSSSEEVKRKDAVKELHPEIYPFSQDDGKTSQFEQELDFTAFSFSSGKSPAEFKKDVTASMNMKGARELEGLSPSDPYYSTIAQMEADEAAIEVEGEEIPWNENDIMIEGKTQEEESSATPSETDHIVIHKEEKKPAQTKAEDKDTKAQKASQANAFKLKPSEKDDYIFPPISLLTKGEEKNVNYDDELKRTAQKLQDTLQSFGVNVRITDISFGPTVTRYEMVPEQGTKVSKIVSLSDDIKLNLAAKDIRIEAPIPGKSAIGIEVPNKDVHMVHFRELIESVKFKNYKSKLAFAVGKDIGGQTVVSDIAKMPHLLIAGATGSGKSVCINTLIMSILYKARPDEVKLIMIDPKMVELSIYNGIPHLLIPVVTDPKKASGALNWAVAEMTERYNKFTTYGVRNIAGYNEKVKQVLASGEVEEGKLQKMPQIVVIVDELADLMMVAPGEVEDAIVRLTQLARAAGIHLVIATQRPSVNVITGLIKANVPSRIAFAVSSGVDSRTIIDMNGAEKLLGKGDMLFSPYGSSKPSRVQGAFIDDDEIAAVVEFLKENETVAVYDESVKEKIEQKIVSQDTAAERDEYFEDAARFILEKDKASIGMLQRMFKIGFNRAARIMDQLAEAGIVGPEEGTKPRKILMSPEQLEQYFEEYL